MIKVKLFCTYDNTVISSSCMLFFGFRFPFSDSLSINVGVNFSLNLMHQITCCAALVSSRIGNVIAVMSHMFICSR